MTDQPLGYWRAALSGKNPQYTDGKPECGFYRDGQAPVAIWLDPEGVMIARKSRQMVDPKSLWLRVCRRPVSHADYTTVVNGGAWSDEAMRAIGDNSSAMGVDQQFADQIATKLEYFRGWLKKSGDAIGWTKETADAASDIKTAIAKIRTDGEKERVKEKQPHLDAGKAVDAKWKAIATAAEAAELEIVKAAQPYLKERKRLQDIADTAALEASRKATEERNAAAATKQPAAPQSAPAATPASLSTAPIKSGSVGKGIRLEAVRTVEIVDVFALAAHFASTPDGRAAARTWALKFGKDAPEGSIPGIIVKTEEVAK
jgi:hypothetical protein